jgi:ABC-2 type transport system ATP-binding protein
MDYVLQTQGLTKRYRRSKALDGLTMGVPKGAIYGLVGKNGAGKTTLIRLICGLQEPTSGSYSLYGVSNDRKELLQTRRRMGAVVETPSIYLNMSARENLEQQALILGLPSLRGLEELLELVGLENAGPKKAGHFSLGMRQRLGLAVALVGDPDFLVLDEPTNGLDPQGIVDMRELILKLNRERQVSFLVSSHILGELSRTATHYGIIDQGRMVKELSAEELEQSCRKRLVLQVTDTAALARTLDGLHLEYKILSESEAELFDKPNVTRLAAALAEAGCEILDLREKDENLESYFLSLVGGAQHG